MANKKLAGIIWPNLPNDVYLLDAEKVNYNKEEVYSDGSVGKALQNKAEIDGYYSDLTAGDAEQLISTMAVEDSVPYKYRTTGGSADVGNREYMNAIVGGTVAWNQLVQNGNFASASNWATNQASMTVSNNKATVTISTSVASNNIYQGVNKSLNHKYLVICRIKPSTNTHASFRFNDIESPSVAVSANIETSLGAIINTGATNASNNLIIYFNRSSEMAASDTCEFKSVQLFDLTQMFGSTIADYVYGLEQSQAGAGVAFFKSLFPNDYYEYDAGELISVSGLLSHDTVGFNLLNKDSSYVGTAAGTTSYRYFDVPIGKTNKLYMGFVDKDTSVDVSDVSIGFVSNNDSSPKSFAWAMLDGIVRSADSDFRNNIVVSGITGVYCGYVFIYPNTVDALDRLMRRYDICVNLSWSGWRNGKYEPYVKYSYPLDSSLTLRGIPKLDASNNLYYDGDEYNYDGSVERRYGIVDLGTLNWSAGTDSIGTYFRTSVAGIKPTNGYVIGNLVCAKYVTTASNSVNDKQIAVNASSGDTIYVRDTAYTDAATFKTAMSGVYLVYELATPTTETADPYQRIQLCDDFGTEEFVSTSIVPVGHNTEYPSNLRDKLQHLPDLADNDGAYLIQQTNKQMSLVLFRIPKAPTTDGTYVLKATVSGGTPTYTWVDESEATE